MKKIKNIIILSIFMILLNLNIVSAYDLDLKLNANKTDVKVGDEVIVTLTLSKAMQAADFSINYDINLLNFKSSSLNNNFYNSTKEPGKILCSWFDTKDTSTFTFTFTAISTGTAKFTTTTENFYDGNLKAASSYNEGNLNITLLSATNENTSTQPNKITSKIETYKPSSIDTLPANTTTNSFGTTNITSTVPIPQTGNNSIIFIFIISVGIIFTIVGKIKLNKLRDI